MLPYRLENRMVEIPVIKGSDGDGRSITSYLWPMHEGERTAQDYIDLARQTEEGTFVLATHSWHICETYSGGVLSDDAAEENLGKVRTIIETLMDDGFRVVSIA